MSIQNRKKIVTEFFQLLAERRPKEGLRFFAPECKQHNPYISGDMNALIHGMMAALKDGASKYPEGEFTVRNVLSDGDMVAVYTQLLISKSTPSEGGLRQVHLFLFGTDNKIVKYWDITQQIQPNMPNSGGAF
jgi:predicted SnoaL-like aldol condensation-catalyzing enzyme